MGFLRCCHPNRSLAVMTAAAAAAAVHQGYQKRLHYLDPEIDQNVFPHGFNSTIIFVLKKYYTHMSLSIHSKS